MYQKLYQKLEHRIWVNKNNFNKSKPRFERDNSTLTQNSNDIKNQKGYIKNSSLFKTVTDIIRDNLWLLKLTLKPQYINSTISKPGC